MDDGREWEAIANAAMERYADGEAAAFGDLYDVLAPRLCAFVERRLRDRAQAEDIVQQTLLHMHCARGRFLRGAAVAPWAFSIARRLLIDGLRRGQLLAKNVYRLDAGALASPPDEMLATRQLAEQLERELARLPKAQRAAFELVKRDGLSLVEAARVLGTTVTAVKLRAHRAYAALKAVIEEGRSWPLKK